VTTCSGRMVVSSAIVLGGTDPALAERL
jgi:hypothetical protein